jgi:hypothetical protein
MGTPWNFEGQQHAGSQRGSYCLPFMGMVHFVQSSIISPKELSDVARIHDNVHDFMYKSIGGHHL